MKKLKEQTQKRKEQAIDDKVYIYIYLSFLYFFVFIVFIVFIFYRIVIKLNGIKWNMKEMQHLK